MIQKARQWLYRDLPPATEIFVHPSRASRLGAQRLATLTAILGEEEALRAAAEAGVYLLEDELCRALRLQGIVLPPDGELAALSPNRWCRPRGEVAWPEGAEACGLQLHPAKEHAFLAFLFSSGARPETPEQLVELAAEYFFAEEVKVVVRYTAPRFPRL